MRSNWGSTASPRKGETVYGSLQGWSSPEGTGAGGGGDIPRTSQKEFSKFTAKVKCVGTHLVKKIGVLNVISSIVHFIKF